MLRRWLYISLGFVLLGSVAFAGINLLGTTKVDPVVNEYREVQSRHLSLYEEDQEFLRRFEIFGPFRAGQSDAGAFLNSRLKWGPDLTAAAQANGSAQAPVQLSVPRKLAEQVLRYRGDWMRHHPMLLKTSTIDFGLFEKLLAFDYWDLETNSPLAKLIESGRFEVPEKIPTPETIDLLTLAKLRLAYGALKKEPLPALEQVRHLAHLLLTTENIHLFSSALSVLDTERRAYRFFVDRGMMQESAWQPVPRNITRRASRVIWASRGYFHVWTEPKTFERVFLGPKLPIGLCAAINEAAPKELSLRPLLASRWPMERDYKAPFSLIDRTISRAKEACRLRYLSRMIELNRFETEFPVPGFLTTLPYSRKVFGLRLATLPFIGFEAYNDKDNPDRQ